MSATAIATEIMDRNLPSRRDDLELVTMPSVVGREAGEKDPYSLRTKMIGEDKIKALRQRKTGGSKLASFYESQNEHINGLLKPMSAHWAEAAQDAENNALKVKIAVNASLVANSALAILQLYAAISSMSLALFASCIDAVDPFANLILWLTHRRSDRANENKWPVRGSRFETSDGNIIYGSIMGGVNVILVVESIQEFVTHTGDDLNKFHLASIVSVAVAFGVKFRYFFIAWPSENLLLKSRFCGKTTGMIS
nr:cation diffusion facilitator 1 [Cryptococcus tetragattii IND107]